MSSRSIILFAVIVLALPAADKPHILYINIDDLGVMDVNYNNSKFNTPHINQLAKDGMIFTNGYAPAANCAPSRACVLSGQWGPRHGVYTVASSERGKDTDRKIIPIKNKEHLPANTFTMASALQAAGYKTIHLGKFHVGNDPLTMGFDVNIGGDASGGPSGGGYFSPWNSGAMKVFSDKYPKNTHRLDVFVDQAVKFMQQNKDQPMFIYFSPYSVHTKLEPIPEFIDKYKGKNINATYASMVEKVDDSIGKLLTFINEAGLADNMLVAFSSDNGGIRSIAEQDPYRAGKGSYYEGGIREPLVMRWPGKIKPGSICDVPVCTLDFYPTFLAAANISPSEKTQLDGVSLLPLMTQEGNIAERALYWHFPIYLQPYSKEKDDGRDPLFRTRPGSAMRFGQWKLHHYFEDDAYELYDLQADIGERHNLADKEPKKLAELQAMLNEWRSTVKAPIPTEKNPKYKQ